MTVFYKGKTYSVLAIDSAGMFVKISKRNPWTLWLTRTWVLGTKLQSVNVPDCLLANALRG